MWTHWVGFNRKQRETKLNKKALTMIWKWCIVIIISRILPKMIITAKVQENVDETTM